ncbi:MAG: hypothetical protein ACFFD8_08695 [Candidatus Thorarchaeota archaeon]
MSLDPEDLDPLRRRDPRPGQPRDPLRDVNTNLVGLIQQLIIRVEQLEKDMRLVKEKLKLK